MIYSKYFLVLISIFILGSCEIKTDDFETSHGSADFSSFVALGDSYSAGFLDGALGYEGQMVSLPKIMSEQFELVGGGAFLQPLTEKGKSVGSTVINSAGDLNGYFELKVVEGSFKPVPTRGDKSILVMRAEGGPFNNLAVPGAKSMHLLSPFLGDPQQGAGNFNPFYTRFASSPGTSSVLTDVALVDPTFFSLWIGGNDVLGYALAGGEGDAITPVINFTQYMTLIVAQLTKDDQKGVIANVPDIDALPFFNLIPYNPLVFEEQDQSKVDALNGGYASYNIGAKAAGYEPIIFQVGANALVVSDPTMELLPEAYRFRQIKSDEKFLMTLPTDKIKTEGWGTLIPVPASYVLSTKELADIKSAVSGYNIAIKRLAETYNLALVDTYQIMKDFIKGKFIDGNSYTTNFVTGGIFSLDGIHATPRGYAILANEFIKSINAQYKASVPLVNINDYSTVVFP